MAEEAWRGQKLGLESWVVSIGEMILGISCHFHLTEHLGVKILLVSQEHQPLSHLLLLFGVVYRFP